MTDNYTLIIVSILLAFGIFLGVSMLSGPEGNSNAGIGAKIVNVGGGPNPTVPAPCNNDTDGGNFTHIFGRVMWGGMTQGTDKCNADGSFLKEYNCVNGKLQTTGWIDCRTTGRTCEGGACVGRCTDGDNGINYNQARTTWGVSNTGISYSEVDNCENGSLLNEFSCGADNNYILTQYNCADEYDGCLNGICTKCEDVGKTCCPDEYGLGSEYSQLQSTCFYDNGCWDGCSTDNPCILTGGQCCNTGEGLGGHGGNDHWCAGTQECWDACDVGEGIYEKIGGVIHQQIENRMISSGNVVELSNTIINIRAGDKKQIFIGFRNTNNVQKSYQIRGLESSILGTNNFEKNKFDICGPSGCAGCFNEGEIAIDSMGSTSPCGAMILTGPVPFTRSYGPIGTKVELEYNSFSTPLEIGELVVYPINILVSSAATPVNCIYEFKIDTDASACPAPCGFPPCEVDYDQMINLTVKVVN